MEVFRLGYFSGTTVEDKGVLVYSDDLLDMKGIVRFDAGGGVFEVTQSASPLAAAGTKLVFPERQEAFLDRCFYKTDTYTYKKSLYTVGDSFVE